jgi:Fe2+ transport system protein FeoA
MKTILAECEGGTRAVVREIRGGLGVARKLNRLGIHADDPIKVIRGGFLGGPVVVEVHGVQLGIGHGMAEKVEVEITP